MREWKIIFIWMSFPTQINKFWNTGLLPLFCHGRSLHRNSPQQAQWRTTPAYERRISVHCEDSW